MKLTTEQKEAIKNQLFETVKNQEKRSRILTVAYGFANENGEDGDLESMVLYLMDKENESQIDELFEEFSMSMPYFPEAEDNKN
jgi:hypothetical protein